jgi:3-deoxy-D-manno-octulosonic-acid transferase
MLLYRLLFGSALALYAPFAFLRRAAGGKSIGDWRGRMGWTDLPRREGAIWIHGVSVGEVAAARSIARALRRRGETRPIVLSASTAAGLARAREAAEADAAIPFPFDLAWAVDRALEAVDPSLVLLTETEIWPLFLSRCERAGIPVALVNGRISERSFRHYRAMRPFFRRTLSRISLFAMQTDDDARRIRAMGAPPERVRVTGNVKFDLDPPPETYLRSRIREWAGGRKVLVAGSTHEGEEEVLLEALGRIDPPPLLVIAPRRPERFDAVAGLAARRGLTVSRRSADESGSPDVVVLDTVGELAAAYGAADVAFLGGTLSPVGGHNPIEAWAQGAPTLVGPHVQNIRELIRRGIQARAAVEVADAGELAAVAGQWLSDDEARGERSRQARDLVSANRGSAAAVASVVAGLRKSA